MQDPTLIDQDELLVAVNKPSGWLIHPAGTDAPDLLGWLATQGLEDWAPAHRIDRGTSGVALFAPKADVAQWAQAFADGGVSKVYQAVVFGKTRAKGRIARPLADGRRGKPLEAVTRYRTLAHYKRCSHLRVVPETGRKHQIRRHLQGIGHALVGDDRYRPRGRPTVPAFPGRLWLHAAELTVGDRTFTAPLPPELEAHLSALRASS